MKTAAKRANLGKLHSAVSPNGAPSKDNKPTSTPGIDLAREVPTMRGLFARSLCHAHHLVAGSDRAACDDGTPCARSSECLKMADNTLTYLENRNRLPKLD